MDRKKQPKNIVLIISDDQGYWSLGSYGNKEIKTPNLDKLGEEGLVFKNFFCTSPVCSPARASILTGKIPSQHGVHDWLDNSSEESKKIAFTKGQETYVDILNKNGYVCGLSGKWHLGASGEKQHGFHHWFAHSAGGGPYYGAQMYRDNQLETEEDYITDVITDDALNFIKENKEKPFYLHVGYTAPHDPWRNSHPEKYTQMYEDCPFDSVPHDYPIHPNAGFLTYDSLRNERESLIGYFAAVTAMDHNIGRIMNLLEELGIKEDTMIIFLSDNGFSCGQNGFWGKGNGTFPLNLYDVTTKVPCIIRYPKLFSHREVNELFSEYDLKPTILDVMNLENPSQEDLPGESMLPILLGDKTQDKSVVVFDEYGPNRMIRNEKFKLIVRYPYGENEFYDLVHDPKEEKNEIENPTYESEITEMRRQLTDWFLQYVNPEIDGTKESVWGSGQVGLAGKWGEGKNSYPLRDYVFHFKKEL